MSTLLLVDDDTALTRVLAEALQLQLGASHDLTVHATGGWEAAMTLAEQLDGLDVLLVDYYLGSRTGTQLCEALRLRHPALVALLYTGKATAAVEAEARKCSMRVLWKPQRLEHLANAVREALEASP